MKSILLILCCIYMCVCLSAQNYTVFGNIKDKANGESLIGASVVVENLNTGVVSNNYGFYSLTIPAGKYLVKCSYIGYCTVKIEVKLLCDTLLNIELENQLTHLSEAVVTAKKNNKVENTVMGGQSIKIETIRKLPSAIGEADIVKSLQYLPGVQTSNEGTTNLSVRGGSFDQNLFLLDGAPVYNPSHALGFFSVFNPDAINSVKIYKGYFPSQYGGRLSSIVDIHMKEGNTKTFNCSGGAGLIASRMTMEGPLVKNKGSFIMSGRYSYAGFTVNSAGSLGQLLGMRSLMDFSNHNEINFYDLNAKSNFRINTRNKIYLSAYSGKDHFYYYAIDNKSSMDWGNITGTARWNHIFNSKIFSNTILAYSKYNYSYILKDDARHFTWSSNLQEVDLKTDFDFFANPANHLKFGLAMEGHRYYPGKIEPRDSSSITKSFALDTERSVMGTVYINNEQKLSEKISLNYGLRYSTFFLLGGNTIYTYTPDMAVIDSACTNRAELVKFYHGIEPRISLRYLINSQSSVKLSYVKTSQYQHLISSSTVGFPSDVWLPANKYIKPQSAYQYSIGYYRFIADKRYEFFTELYLRAMDRVIDFRDNADLFLNPHIETQVLPGKGQSYGMEFYLEKKTGKFTGWLSYTLSKTTKQIDGINNNNSYPVTYDKRHNVSTVLNYTLSGTWSLSSVFKFTSGGYVTIPEGTFMYYGAAFNYYTERNGYKLPPYHRLDIAFNYTSMKNELRKWKTEWVFGVYNVYARKNIFALFIRQDDYFFNSSNAYKMYLYSVTPYLTFNFKF